MKIKYCFLMVAAIGFMCGACTKKVRVDEEKVKGALEGAFKVTTGEYIVEKDANGVEYINVEITRTKQSVPYTDDKISVISAPSKNPFTLAGFGYTCFDKNDSKIKEVEASDNDATSESQLELLQLKAGESGNLKIKFADQIPGSVEITSDLEIVNTGEIALNGAIGKYGVKNFTLDLDVKKKHLNGQYQYLTSPAGAFLYLQGELLSEKVDDQQYIFKINIQESPDRYTWSGEFDGTLSLVRDDETSPYYYKLIGDFLSFQMKNYNYSLTSEPLGSNK